MLCEKDVAQEEPCRIGPKSLNFEPNPTSRYLKVKYLRVGAILTVVDFWVKYMIAKYLGPSLSPIIPRR